MERVLLEVSAKDNGRRRVNLFSRGELVLCKGESILMMNHLILC